MKTEYVACYWYSRLGKWIEFYSSKDRKDCEQMAEMQKAIGDKVKIIERRTS